MSASLNFIRKHNMVSLHLIMKATAIVVLFLLRCGLIGVNGVNSISENDISQDDLLNRNTKTSAQTQEDGAEINPLSSTSTICTICETDIHAVLRDMTAKIAELGADLRNTIEDLERLRTKYEGKDILTL